MKNIWLMALLAVMVASFGYGCARPPHAVAPDLVPDGAIHKAQKVWRLSPPDGFGAALAWAQVATKNAYASNSAVAYVASMKLIKVKDGAQTVVSEDKYSGAGPLPADRGGLYIRIPNWFANDGHTAITNSRIMDDKLVLFASETPSKIIHWWTNRVPIEKDAQYYVEADFMIIGDASIQFGVDYWRDLYVGHNGWDANCIGKNNCEAWVSPWFGPTGNAYAKVKVPL